MCGIVGFTGHRQAAPVLLDGLAKLEYRGYDSAGLAVRNGENEVEIVKAKGRLRVLAEKTNDGTAMHGTCGIGHTRWATHGEPSELNAHPHCSDDRNVVGVHNGIIENYQELREKLQHKGYNFYSDTDTEVAIKLIDYYYKKYEHTPVDAINHAMVRIRGSYALAIMFRDYPEEIYAARKDSPMIIGVADDAGMHSSQNEQDSRHYAIAAKVPMLEPSDSAEALAFTKIAYEISEKYDTPVFMKMCTRVAHSQSLVETSERVEPALKEYKKDIAKYVMMPANAKRRHPIVEQRTRDLIAYAETTPLNRVEMGDTKIGIITSSTSYQFQVPDTSFPPVPGQNPHKNLQTAPADL